jgi:hypothetical protein
MFDLLDPKPVRRLLDDHQSGRQDNHKILFSMVMVEQWLRRTRSNQVRFIETGVTQGIANALPGNVEN